MANVRLKKTILEVVDNQLNANDPPCTKEVYGKLLEAGYSKSEAKDKIGAVILTEIYDILKDGQEFDEEAYKDSQEEMLRQSVDYEDDHHIETEWDGWDDLIEEGYACFIEENPDEGLRFWQEAEKLFFEIMEQNQETGTLSGLMEELNYAYPIDDWLEDYVTEFGNAGKYEEIITFCRSVLELFDWRKEDDSCFRCGIGESLYRMGKPTQAYEYFEEFLAENPQSVNGINTFSQILCEDGEAQRAYELIRNAIWDVPCDMENSILFLRAKHLADLNGEKEESRRYQQRLDEFEEAIRGWETDDDMFSDEFMAQKQASIVKEKKIYPNDPCPCGSGKKYKKCCGRR